MRNKIIFIIALLLVLIIKINADYFIIGESYNGFICTDKYKGNLIEIEQPFLIPDYYLFINETEKRIAINFTASFNTSWTKEMLNDTFNISNDYVYLCVGGYNFSMNNINNWNTDISPVLIGNNKITIKKGNKKFKCINYSMQKLYNKWSTQKDKTKWIYAEMNMGYFDKFWVYFGTNSTTLEFDITSPNLAGADYVWLDNMAKNETNVTKIVTDSLIAYYDLNLNADDRVGSYDGTISGAVNTTGHLGDSDTALEFDGINQNITLLDITETNNAITISLWYKSTSTIGNVVLYSDLGTGYYILETSVNKFRFRNYNGTTVVSSTGTTTYSGDEWYHVVGMWDGSIQSIYVNGVLENSNFMIGTVDVSGGSLPRIGDWVVGGSSVNGSIDNVRIYNRSLSAEEIKALYQERNDNHSNGSFSTAFCIKDCINETGLVAQWELNGNALDRTGRYNGTITGAVNKTDCRYGDCMGFNGSAITFDSDTFFLINKTGEYENRSVSFWAKKSYSAEGGYILAKGAAVEYGFYLSATSVSLYPDNTKLLACTSADVLWHHWVLAISSGGETDVYKDGLLCGSGQCDYVSGVNLIYIGNRWGGSAATSFDGSIDNVMIWNRSLPQEEIYKLYLSGYEHYLPDAALKKIEYDGDAAGTCSLSDITDDCDTRAVSHWKLDNNAVDCNNRYNGTITQATNTTGFFDNGMHFNGTSQYISVGTGFDITEDFTYSAWAKWDRVTGLHTIMSYYESSVSSYQFDTASATSKLRLLGRNATNQILTGTTDMVNGVWYHTVATYDDSENTAKIYLDGKLEASSTTFDGAGAAGGTGFTIGSERTSVYEMNGSIDDVRLYNYSLSAYEVWELYNARFNSRTSYSSGETIDSQADFGICELDGTYFSYLNFTFADFPSNDTIPPAVNLISPANNSWENSRTITFIAVAEDNESSIENCSLYTNETTWGLKHSNTTCLNATNCSITETFSSDGHFLWNYLCFDYAGNSAFNSTNFTVNVDLSPSIAINSPANTSSVAKHWALLNSSVSDTNEMTVLIFANDNSSRLNTQDGLVYIESGVSSGEIIYNLTTIPIQHDSDGLVALYHFDNRSEYGENNTNVYDFSGNGNNGTVTGAVWNESGKMAGAYEYDGSNTYINTNFNTNFNQSSWTIYAWAKLSSARTSCLDGANIFTKDWDYRLFMSTSCQLKTITRNISGDDKQMYDLGDFSDGLWHNVLYTYNYSENKSYIYFDGILQDSTVQEGIYSNNVDYTIGGRILSTRWNGSIDEVVMWNKTFSATEIKEMYQLQSKTYYWKVNATDVAGNSNESDVWEFEAVHPTITANFSNSIGIIRDDFYGVNTHYNWFVGDYYLIDLDDDGSKTNTTNSTWHSESLLNANINYLRWDMSLQARYEFLYNLDMEDWINNSIINYIGTSNIESAHGWGTNFFYGNGSAYRTTDAHSGNYAIQINVTIGHIYLNRGDGIGDILLKNESSYNISWWAKGEGNLRPNFQDKEHGYADCSGSSSIPLTSTWTQYSMNCTITSLSVDEKDNAYRFTFDVYGNATLDDFSITEDNVQMEEYKTWWFSGSDLSKDIDGVKWANDNDVRILVIASYTPIQLANFSANCSDLSSKTRANCPPMDYDVFGQIVVDWINRTTSNGTYLNVYDVEVWNEPDIHFFMQDLSTDDQLKADYYALIYNATYTNIKNNFPSIPVGGTGQAYFTSSNMIKTFMSNFSNRMDFFTYHRYITSDYYDDIQNTINIILGNCSLYSANCSRIIISETNLGCANDNNAIKNTTSRQNEFSNYFAQILSGMLNSQITSNVSFNTYQWADPNSYFNNPTHYSEYPSFWSMVSEKGLDNKTKPTYYSPYNITKNFATYHRRGSTVYSSTSDNSDIKIVVSKYKNSSFITIINTDSEQVNITLNLENYSHSSIKDMEDGTTYAIVNNVTEIGLLSGYEIKYLGFDEESPKITIDSPSNTTYTTTTTYFNVTLDEEGSLCKYTLDDWVTNYTMTKQGNIKEFKAVNSTMSQGSHTVKFWCNDTSNNINDTEDVTFFIDSVAPFWYDNQTNHTTRYNEVVWFSINWTDINGVNFSTFSWNSTDNFAFHNDTHIPCNLSTSCVHNVSHTINLTRAEDFCWKFYANDTVNNWNQSDTWCFTVNTTAPTTPNVIYPINNSYYLLNNITLNISSSDVDGDAIYYYHFIDGAINSTTIDTNSTANLTDGNWSYYCIAGDTYMNSTASELINFILDTTYPLIFNETRVTDPVTTGANATFLVNITENNWDTVIFSFTKWSQDFSSYVWTNYTVTNYTGNSTHRNYNFPLDYNLIYSTQGIGGENYTWFFWVNDSVGHTNQTDNNTFEVFPVCGNGICEGGESSSTCPADCGTPSGPGGTGGGGGGGGGGVANVTKLEPGQYTTDPLKCSSGTTTDGICINMTISYIISPKEIHIKNIPDYVSTEYLYVTNNELKPLVIDFKLPELYKAHFKWVENYSIAPYNKVKFDLSFKTPPIVNTKYEFDMIANLNMDNLTTYKVIPVIVEAIAGKLIGESCNRDVECLSKICKGVCKLEVKQSLFKRMFPFVIILLAVISLIIWFFRKRKKKEKTT